MVLVPCHPSNKLLAIAALIAWVGLVRTSKSGFYWCCLACARDRAKQHASTCFARARSTEESSKAIKPSKKQGDPSNKLLGIALNKYVKNLLVARILCVTTFKQQVGSYLRSA